MTENGAFHSERASARIVVVDADRERVAHHVRLKLEATADGDLLAGRAWVSDPQAAA